MEKGIGGIEGCVGITEEVIKEVRLRVVQEWWTDRLRSGCRKVLFSVVSVGGMVERVYAEILDLVTITGTHRKV